MPPCRLTGNFPNRTSTEIPVLIQFEGNDWLDVGGNLAACIRWPKIVIEVHLDWDTNQVGYRVRQFLRELRIAILLGGCMRIRANSQQQCKKTVVKFHIHALPHGS